MNSNPALSSLPKIVVLATGGTIAGVARDAISTVSYQAGAQPVGRLLSEVPALSQLAQLEAEQVASVDSKDMNMALWAALVTRITALLARPEVDGIVITHGTDTLEETAYLLHLTVKSTKPVVMTAAMRPATALSADGPLNLFNAVTVAADPRARSRGVLVAFNHRIHSAREVSKTSTYAADAFQSLDLGVLGWVQDGRVDWQRDIVRTHTCNSEFNWLGAELPPVEIVVSYAGASRAVVDACVAAGVRGIIVAGTGNGTIHTVLQEGLVEAVLRSVAVVRSTRVGAGRVVHNGAVADALGFVSAGSLNPYKARVLLMLALNAGITSAEALQRVFDRY